MAHAQGFPWLLLFVNRWSVMCRIPLATDEAMTCVMEISLHLIDHMNDTLPISGSRSCC